VGWLGVLDFDCFHDFAGAFVSEMGIYDDGVNNSRYPKEQGQDNVEQELNGLADI
jgi:hypothetical protein